MQYNNAYYYYVKDIFGNIVQILNESGTIIAEYEYDAWGNCTVEQTASDYYNIADINPFRYRGYYMDTETGLYYCNYRYYSPKLYRFISPDSIEYLEPETSGLNLYAYCYNNPIMYTDPSGHFAIAALIIGAVFGFAGTMITDLLDDGKLFNGSLNSWDYLGNILAGTIGGLAGAMHLNMIGSMIFSVAGDIIGGLISGNIDSWEKFGQIVALSIGVSIFSYGVSSAVSDAFGTSQYKAIRGVSTKNIKVNRYIKGLKGSFKRAGVTALRIGRNSIDDFLRAFQKTTSNVIVTEIAGNMVSTSIGFWF